MTIDKTLIKGSLHGIYGNKLVYVSYSKNENKYLLETYIRYLFSIVNGLNHELYFISANKENVFQGSPISRQEALKRLTELVQLYKKGHEEIIAFFPDFKIMPADIDVLDEKILRKALDGFFHNFSFPCDDRYLLNEYQNGFFKFPDIVERYKANAQILTKPLGEIFPSYF